jgi:hypothetical protein
MAAPQPGAGAARGPADHLPPPGADPGVAGERGKPRFDEAVKLLSDSLKSPEGDRPKTADTKQWAASVLSGFGTK